MMNLRIFQIVYFSIDLLVFIFFYLISRLPLCRITGSFAMHPNVSVINGLKKNSFVRINIFPCFFFLILLLSENYYLAQ